MVACFISSLVRANVCVCDSVCVCVCVCVRERECLIARDYVFVGFCVVICW